MTSSVTPVAIVSLAVLLASPAAPGAAAVKCERFVHSQPDDPDWLYVLDGESLGPIEDRPTSDIDRLDIETVQVVCRPEALKFFGVSGARGVVAIFTERGLIGAMQTSLRRLMAAQEAHYARHGAYSGSLEGLAGYSPAWRLTMTLTAADGGWFATANVPALDWECHIGGGTTTASSAAATEGEPTCRPVNY